MPTQFWLIGNIVEEIDCPEITHKISIPGGLIDELISETKCQLQLKYVEETSEKFEPPYLIFAVGIYDLVPDKNLTNLRDNLNALVSRQRHLRDEFGGLIANLAFPSVYPPIMSRLGASSTIEFHEQQFVDIVFRFYNKWTMTLNFHNRAPMIRMCRAFRCYGGKYNVKPSHLKEDGYQPSTDACRHLTTALSKSVSQIRDNWGNEQPSKGRMIMLESNWSPIKKAESIYLKALSGEDTTKRVVHVPVIDTCQPENQPKYMTKDARKVMGNPSPSKTGNHPYQCAQEDLYSDFSVNTCPESLMPHFDDRTSKTLSDCLELKTVATASSMADCMPRHLHEAAQQMLEQFKRQELAIFSQRQREDRCRLDDFYNELQHIGHHGCANTVAYSGRVNRYEDPGSSYPPCPRPGKRRGPKMGCGRPVLLGHRPMPANEYDEGFYGSQQSQPYWGDAEFYNSQPYGYGEELNRKRATQVPAREAVLKPRLY